jgi:hypothetical protein
MEAICSSEALVDITGLHGVLLQKTELFIVTTVRTSNPPRISTLQERTIHMSPIVGVVFFMCLQESAPYNNTKCTKYICRISRLDVKDAELFAFPLSFLFSIVALTVKKNEKNIV